MGEKSRLIIEHTGQDFIYNVEIPISKKEGEEVIKYLKWLRSKDYGSFEAIVYKADGYKMLDTIISERKRNKLDKI